jgi:glycosyltransferase involved in cell wall biosynthesis
MARILIASQYYFGDQPQGADRLAWDEAVWFAKQGHAVDLSGFDPSGKRPAVQLIEGVRVLRYHLDRSRRLWNAHRLHSDALAVRLSQEVRQGRRWDVIHAHNVLMALGAFRDEISLDAKLVLTLHSPILDEVRAERSPGLIGWLGSELRGRVAHAIEASVLARSDLAAAHSRFCCSLAARRHPKHSDKLTWLRAWVHADRFRLGDREEARSRLGWESGVPTFFTLRRLVRRMGLPRLLDAVSILVREGRVFRLKIAGAGILKDELQAQSVRLGLETTVSFLGRLPEDQLPDAYLAADAFILPTAALEGFGLIALESFTAGTPVLATPVGAIPEIVGAVEPRWLAEAADAASIAKLLRDHLDGKLPVHPAGELRDWAIRHYDAQVAIPELCEAVLSRKAR